MAEPDALQDAVDIISAAATADSGVIAARHYSQPLTDAYSVAAASLGHEVREPDAEVERGLAQGEALAAASGLMTHPLDLDGRWWTELTGPVVAGERDSAVAVLPGGHGATLVTGGDRRVRRMGHRTRVQAPAITVTGDLPQDATWRQLVWWSLRHQRLSLWGLLLLSLIGGLAGLLLPLASAALFSYALPSGSGRTVAAVLGAFAIGSAGAAVILLARNMTLLHLRDVSDSTLSTGVMAHTLRLP